LGFENEYRKPVGPKGVHGSAVNNKNVLFDNKFGCSRFFFSVCVMKKLNEKQTFMASTASSSIYSYFEQTEKKKHTLLSGFVVNALEAFNMKLSSGTILGSEA
jgi:hypothetical protein